MSPFIGCIADDFTGAVDISNNFTISGFQTVQYLNVPKESYTGTDDALVVALKIRSIRPQEATIQAVKALKWLQSAGCTLFYWKYCSTFDSTATGNIGPVAEALLKELGAQRTIYCPSFPENRRTVYKGNLFVGEVPLAESSMRDHPLNPMRDSSLLRLLAPQTTKPVANICWEDVQKGSRRVQEKIDNLSANGKTHITIDAINNRDLTTIAKAVYKEKLLTGGSGLAWALPKVIERELGIPLHHNRRELPKQEGKRAIIAGSCSVATRKQIAYAKKQKIPFWVLDDLKLLDSFGSSIDEVVEWINWAYQKSDILLIHSENRREKMEQVKDRVGESEAGALVERAFKKIASSLYSCGVRRFIVAGGETSGAVVQALNIKALSIGPQIDPGVPWAATFGKEPVLLALKSGNFGSEEFFIKSWSIC